MIQKANCSSTKGFFASSPFVCPEYARLYDFPLEYDSSFLLYITDAFTCTYFVESIMSLFQHTFSYLYLSNQATDFHFRWIRMDFIFSLDCHPSITLLLHLRYSPSTSIHLLGIIHLSDTIHYLISVTYLGSFTIYNSSTFLINIFFICLSLLLSSLSSSISFFNLLRLSILLTRRVNTLSDHYLTCSS